jgi:hypothetical protein
MKLALLLLLILPYTQAFALSESGGSTGGIIGSDEYFSEEIQDSTIHDEPVIEDTTLSEPKPKKRKRNKINNSQRNLIEEKKEQEEAPLLDKNVPRVINEG